MSENCNHDCSSCSSNCGERKEPQSFLEKPHELSRIKKVIGVVSGKGGVGKSLVTSLLTVAMQKKNYKTAILDADITGPSIPNVFGITERAQGSEAGLLPVSSKGGTEIMSINLLLQDQSDPVVWRGPIIAGTVKQFWTEVIWNDVDYMFVDMPPGTGDVPLTVFRSLPVDGIVIVTSPQELVSMIVGKAVKMAEMMDIPVLGVVENMSYFMCPSCNEKHYIFGESHVDELAARYAIDTVAQLPFDKELAGLCDGGRIEEYDKEWLSNIADKIERL
ncbi:MAG: Mrp/NBP35 family ATP-binding protein [Clostridia bacterium]|nr:Mrp/NBP35 family ATP-binding protein [Clostridia bacterium]